MAARVGRPAGSGISDGATLTKIADMLVAGQAKTANAAIMKIYKKDSVSEPSENFRRRLQRKWSEQKKERTEEAQMKHNERNGARLNLTKSVVELSLRASPFEGLPTLPSNSPPSKALLDTKHLDLLQPRVMKDVIEQMNEIDRLIPAHVRQIHETIMRITAPTRQIQEAIARITAPL